MRFELRHVEATELHKAHVVVTLLGQTHAEKEMLNVLGNQLLSGSVLRLMSLLHVPGPSMNEVSQLMLREMPK